MAITTSGQSTPKNDMAMAIVVISVASRLGDFFQFYNYTVLYL